jgi:hypothetical protein
VLITLLKISSDDVNKKKERLVILDLKVKTVIKVLHILNMGFILTMIKQYMYQKLARYHLFIIDPLEEKLNQ